MFDRIKKECLFRYGALLKLLVLKAQGEIEIKIESSEDINLETASNELSD